MSSFPHIVEKRIQAAMERGEFERLPGLGQPIADLDQPYDELWWIRKWMEREALSPAKELRAEGGKAAVRVALEEIRERRQRR